MRDNSNSIKKT